MRRISRNWQIEGDDRTRSVGSVCRPYGAAHGFHEPATDRQAEPGSGAHPVTLTDPVELVKNLFDVLLRDTLAFIDDLKLYAATDLFSPMLIVEPAGEYFAALSRMLNSTCSNNTGSSFSIGSLSETSK